MRLIQLKNRRMVDMRYWTLLVSAATIVLGTATGSGTGHAETAKISDPEKSAIREIIREYLVENPEVIEEAIRALRSKREAEERAQAQAALSTHQDRLLRHPMTPVSGNPDGKVTVVEFFDYQCGYCKRSLASMVNLLEADKDVRVVWKELPILGPESRLAARAAMAAKNQSKYFEFHIALMGSRGRLSDAKVMSLAKEVGLDVQRLQTDMKDPAIEAYLDETLQLANALGIRGTPAFVIGDTLVPGAIDEAGMMQLIAKTRAGG
jgi:protein-disulfide isomerase